MVEKKKIKIQNLMLDTNNYRIGHQEGQPQAIRSIVEEQGDKLKVLAEDIMKNGLSPIELFMAMPSQGSKTQHVVIEGNRRTTAIKLVLNPELASGTEQENAFKRLHEKYSNDVPQEIECVVVPTKKDGLLWIQRRHDRGLNGAGVEDWSSTARDRADSDLGKYTPAKDVREFVLANSQLSDALHKKISGSKFNNTNLTRLLGTASIRDVLGMKKDQEALSSTASQEWLLKVLTDMVVAIASEEFDGQPFSEATIDKKEQREEFVEKLVQKHSKPAKKVKSWIIKAEQKVHSASSNASTNVGKGSVKTTPSSADRKFVIPSTCKIKLPDGKPNDVYHELRKLEVDKFPNSAAVLLRVFLEFSVETYIKNKSISLVTDNKGKLKDSLVNKLEVVEKYMTTNKVMTTKELKSLRTAISNKESLFSTETLNAYVHDPSFNPKAMELKLTWNNFQVFFEKLWQA
jgi:hypothetical protein